MTERRIDDPSYVTTLLPKDKETKDDALTTTVIALIVVASALFLISFVAICCACRFWRLYRMLIPTGSLHESTKDALKEDIVENGLKEDENCAKDNVSNAGENIDTPVPTETQTTDNQLKTEEQDETYTFNWDSGSLGFNTIAKREHKFDQQMFKLQELFQSFRQETVDSETTLYPILHSEKVSQDSPATIDSKEQSNLWPSNASTSKPDENAVNIIPNSEVLQKQLQDNGDSTTTLPNSLPVENQQIIDDEETSSDTDLETHF